MEVDAHIGRILMVAPPDDWLERSRDWFDDFQPAGIILFRRHLPDDLGAARAAVARLHAWGASAGRPLLIAADEEGGFVTQTPHLFPVPPSARALAWAASPAEVRGVYARYGARLQDLGIDWDFAPVCDVNDNPRNPVIGVRSFGNTPDLVRDYAGAAQAGLEDAGVLSCLKHFPGHGDTDVDSHLALPVLAHGRDRLDRVELVPFRGLLDAAPAVMVAHLACPQLGDGDLPATLSACVTTDLLRGELGFRGVAITDAMEMEGVAGVFGRGEAAVRALLAGCDLLLYCFELEGVEEARAGIRAALDSGRLPMARLSAAAARVEKLATTRKPSSTASKTRASEAAADARAYRELCSRALRLENAPGWQMLEERASRERLWLVGWNDEVLRQLSGHLAARGIDSQCSLPGEIARSGWKADSPTLVVLAERRPLEAEAVASLRQIAAPTHGAGLVNLLTPEVDAPLRDHFPTRLQTADKSDLMLDVVAEACFGRQQRV